MGITSFAFYVFAAAVVAVYFLIPRRWQWVVLLLASFAIYATAGRKAVALLALSIAIVYVAGLQIEKISAQAKAALQGVNSPEAKRSVRELAASGKRVACVTAVIAVMGIWVALKFAGFFVQNANALLSLLHARALRVPNIALPLGISFYTFHAVGYLVDVYRGKYPAERNFFRFALFVSYFPHMLQGPFSRYDALGETLFAQHSFSYDRLCEGCRRILWGLFKKLCVADKLGVAVAAIFANPSSNAGFLTVSGAILYSFQIYADFSAYMDIVCGISHILGVEMAENFSRPYFAQSVEEFWRRWHITLGQWFRDYVFYPISMSKPAMNLSRKMRQKYGAKMGKLIPSYIALIFVWTCTGLWHGASWNFAVWGWLNLLIILFSMQFGDAYERIKAKLHIRSDGKAWRLFRIVRTFLIVSMLRLFSRARSIGDVAILVGRIFAAPRIRPMLRNPLSLFPSMRVEDVAVALLGVGLMLLVDILQERGCWERVKSKCPILLRNAVYVALIFALILFAGTTKGTEGFIYADF